MMVQILMIHSHGSDCDRKTSSLKGLMVPEVTVQELATRHFLDRIGGPGSVVIPCGLCYELAWISAATCIQIIL